MSILLSRGCEYGLQAMIYLASRNSSKPILKQEIASALDIPAHFLGKILQNLARAGILISHKGKTGGFLLGKKADEIFPYDVIEAIDGKDFFKGCVLGFTECNPERPCPIHFEWEKVHGQVILMLKSKNILELSESLHKKMEFIQKIQSLVKKS